MSESLKKESHKKDSDGCAGEANSMGRDPGKQHRPLQTTVIGSYPFPGWLEFASAHLEQFGEADIEELRTDAVIAAVHDQLAAGLDVITDGEQTRYDFNLSFYGRLEGIDRTPVSPRNFGPPAHDQRGKYEVTGPLRSRTAWEQSRNSNSCKRLRRPVRC